MLLCNPAQTTIPRQKNHIMVLSSLFTTRLLIHTTTTAPFSEKDIHITKTVDNVDKTVDNQ